MAHKNIKRSISMSQEMHDLLTQLAAKRGRDVTEASLIREALHQFLDKQSDMVGSRRHFQKSLQERLDRLEKLVSFQFNIIIFLLADDSAIEDAIIAAKRDRDGEALTARIKAVYELDVSD